jgi:hypothetical protein
MEKDAPFGDLHVVIARMLALDPRDALLPASGRMWQGHSDRSS